MTKKRIVILVNKWWEADPVTSVFLHDKARPKDFENIRIERYPTQRCNPPSDSHYTDPSPRPRLILDCNGVEVELWCLEELMSTSESSSSTFEKARVLEIFFKNHSVPNAVIAVGTAGMDTSIAMGGSVVIGSRVFVHDPFAKSTEREKMWKPPRPNQIIESGDGAKLVSAINDDVRFSAECRFLRPPIQSAEPMRILSGNSFISIGVVNIVNYDDYIWADRAAIDAFKLSGARGHIGSIETTHGVIREYCKAAFIFISGITDTLGRFDFEVNPRVYAQNTACAHNAGVALAWILPIVAEIAP